MKNMEKSDKFTYVSILVLGIISIIIITCFILSWTTNVISTSVFSSILIKLNISSSLNDIFFKIILIIVIFAIPYLIYSIILSIKFIIRYIEFDGEKKNKIIKNIVLFSSIVLLIIFSLYLFPWSGQYEIKVNSYISQCSNLEVRQFLQDELNDDYYVYKIKIVLGFPDDYYIDIYYRNIIPKVKSTFMSDYNYEFVENNATDLTVPLSLEAITLMVFADALYIYFLIYILKEFKRIIE